MKRKKPLVLWCVIVMVCMVATGMAWAEEPTVSVGVSAPQQIDESALEPDERMASTDEAVVVAEKADEISMFDERLDEAVIDEIADPLYPLNVVNFHINDGLHNWVLNPVAKGYKHVVPEPIRVGVSNVFNNLLSPVNMVNNLLQFKLDRFGTELFRFAFNTVIGIGGIFDASYNLLDIDKQEADFGQTLSFYGIGHGIYVVWPILGPSSLRETVGFAGDTLASPTTYIGYHYLTPLESAGVVATDMVNDKSFAIGNYEMLIGNAPDPYEAMKNAFVQCRKKKTQDARER